MPTVYRLQHKTVNIGPYWGDYCRGCKWWDEFVEYSGRADSHPSKWIDGLDNYGKEYYYGFDSLTKLTTWFGNYLHQIVNECGFIIAEYEVDEYHYGYSRKQVVFIPTKFIDITSQVVEVNYNIVSPESHAYTVYYTNSSIDYSEPLIIKTCKKFSSRINMDFQSLLSFLDIFPNYLHLLCYKLVEYQ